MEMIHAGDGFGQSIRIWCKLNKAVVSKPTARSILPTVGILPNKDGTSIFISRRMVMSELLLNDGKSVIYLFGACSGLFRSLLATNSLAMPSMA